jgi:hypothetical protein
MVVGRRRKRLAALGAGLVLLVATGAFTLWPRADRITQENCDRIFNEKMGREEILSLLGRPGDYRSGPTAEAWYLQGAIASPKDENVEWVEWKGDNAMVRFEFDATGRVKRGDYSALFRIAQSRFDDVLWRLKRQWRKWFPE